MNKAVARMLGVSILLSLLSLPAGVAAAQNRDAAADQPHMQAALNALHQAEQHLNQAIHDKAGHRVAALKATQNAIRQVEMGIRAGAKDA
ncbi:MAG TPA: hypothetical protein VFY05_12325, partial [Candidatus Angelobacter sp.]|nr:hypothetical protein [Candidatus Angelobacter sp.]